MAAVAEVQTVNITINDTEIAVPKGELIVEAVKRVGLEIPIFCYHPRMKPVGMCRMCLVEVGMKQPDGSVRKMPKPQAACTLPASEGLVIYTDTEMVHNDRRGVLEFLLINHPLDCPICDRGGECPLQNNTLFYGPSTSRYVEIKRHAPKAFPLSKYVTLDLERCIQCGRCVRFTEEISGDAQLAFRFRGASMQPSTFEMLDFTSKFSGNVIEICPVGALTNAKYRFRARPWDLETKPSVCTVCSNGCNIWFDTRVNKLVRVNGRTNEAVNEEWTCDRGKFGHYFYNADDRLTQPLVRDGDRLVPADWAQAYSQILGAFTGGGTVAALAGQMLSNEDLYCLKTVFRDGFGSQNVDHRFTATLPKAADALSAKMGVERVQSQIEEIEDAKSILVFGTSLADEEPIVFLRVRKAWFKNGARVYVANDVETDVDSFAQSIVRYRPGTAGVVAAGLLARLVSLGKSTVPPATASAIAAYTPERVESESGVSAGLLNELAAAIDADTVVLTTSGLFDLTDGQSIAETLASVGLTTGAKFNLLARGANEYGADLLGLGADGLNTHEILQGCADGTVKALWLAGVDPFEVHPDRELVERALENVEFLVVSAVAKNGATPFASVILPATAPAEQDGSYTNVEGRVQRIRPILKPLGEAKATWRILSEVGLRVRPASPFFNAGEVLAKVAQEVPAFAGIGYDQIGGEGFLLGVGPDSEREAALIPQTNG